MQVNCLVQLNLDGAGFPSFNLENVQNKTYKNVVALCLGISGIIHVHDRYRYKMLSRFPIQYHFPVMVIAAS